MEVKRNMVRFFLKMYAELSAKVLPYRNVQQSKEKWEDEYASGHWKWLHSLQQLMRYKAIAAYFSQLSHNGSVLDVGCGDGHLQEALLLQGYSYYLGIDISDEAINEVKYRESDITHFLCVDVSDFAPERSFDVIIFNEILYYFLAPMEILGRYNEFLSEGGVFIISMYSGRPLNKRLWKMVEKRYTVLDEVNILHGSGRSWVIKVLKPEP